MKYMTLIAFMMAMPVSASGYITENLSGRIAYINAERFDVVRIAISAEDIENPDECGTAGAVTLKGSDSSTNRQYSLLLAAFMANKPVKIHSNGCIPLWGTSFPQVSAVYVHP